MKSLIIAEHDNTTLKPSTLNCVAAGLQIESSCDVLVAGHQAADVAKEAARLEGVVRVWHIDAPQLEHAIAENLVQAILKIAGEYTHILAPATTFGKNFMPRIAAKLDVAQISDVIEVQAPDTFVRPIYAGNALQTLKSDDAVKVLTVRCSAFTSASESSSPAPIEGADVNFDLSRVAFVQRELSKSERPELSSARVVVSGGRALQSGENFKILESLGDTMNAAIGASRAAVDAGFVPNDYQVGQTGKVVAPDLYFAIGISGAVQHVAGMKDSKCIVAINKDADAPIFDIATYGLVGDLFEIVPELTQELQNLLSS